MNDAFDLDDLNIYLALHDKVIVPGYIAIKIESALSNPWTHGASTGAKLFERYSDCELVGPPVFPTEAHQDELNEFFRETIAGHQVHFPKWVDTKGQTYLRWFEQVAYFQDAICGRVKTDEAHRIREKYTNAVVLFFSHYLSSLHGGDYRPVLKADSEVYFGGPRRPSDVALRLLMEDILLPSPETPVEAIIDFRADVEVHEHLLAFRSFARQLDKLLYSIDEAAEEYELRLRQYNRYIEKHRLNFKRQKWDVMLSYPVSIIHDLLKLDIPGAFKKVLRIKQCFSYEEPSLSKGDPGYELALIGDFRNLGGVKVSG